MKRAKKTNRQPKRILIIRPDRIGDVMLASGIPSAIKSQSPDIFVGFLASTKTAPLLAHNPHIDHMIEDRGQSICRLARELRRLHFDTAFLLVQSKRHAWMVRLAGIRNRYGIGGKPYEFLCGIHGLPKSKRALRHQSGLDIVGLGGLELPNVRPTLTLTQTERQKAHEDLHNHGWTSGTSLVGLQLTHGKSSTNWPLQRWIDLADLLCSKGHVVVGHAFGIAPKHRAYIVKRFKARPFWLLPDTSIRYLAAIISHCSVFVGPNTGPIHMAAALHVPAIALYCPMPALSPLSWMLPGETPLTPEEDICNPCPGPSSCNMETLTAEQVLQETEKTLGQFLPNA